MKISIGVCDHLCDCCSLAGSGYCPDYTHTEKGCVDIDGKYFGTIEKFEKHHHVCISVCQHGISDSPTSYKCPMMGKCGIQTKKGCINKGKKNCVSIEDYENRKH